MLGFLVSAIPGLVEALLGVPSAEAQGAPRLLETLCEAVRTHAVPLKDPDKEDAEAKGRDEERSVFLGDLFDFMDALAFFVAFPLGGGTLFPLSSFLISLALSFSVTRFMSVCSSWSMSMGAVSCKCGEHQPGSVDVHSLELPAA